MLLLDTAAAADKGGVIPARRFVCFVLLPGCLCVAACASTPPSLALRVTAPNPTGCYVRVFDREQLRGTGDFINGPMRYSTLGELPNRANWSRRIRSLEVGRGAAVTLWTNPNRSGKSMDVRADGRYSALPADFAGKVESMDVRCD
jgi:hypothetical protein